MPRLSRRRRKSQRCLCCEQRQGVLQKEVPQPKSVEPKPPPTEEKKPSNVVDVVKKEEDSFEPWNCSILKINLHLGKRGEARRSGRQEAPADICILSSHDLDCVWNKS